MVRVEEELEMSVSPSQSWSGVTQYIIRSSSSRDPTSHQEAAARVKLINAHAIFSTNMWKMFL